MLNTINQNPFILKTKVLLSQIYVTLADVGFSLSLLIYLLPKTFKLFGFVYSGSSTNKTDCHDIGEILLKVGLNTINQNLNHQLYDYLEL
jgi:hypothetical protein